ncbi:hypothetical protein FSP39_001835 [Pinctada imbricata]|uniref:Uncharacterized protein n=1 Tax=Pinctada imbricata TaxID=66713 RepID=A0AA88XKJ4_PINIB|nr:hypothetical protein FSP39_001835 [Pinctada imbricata]
MKSYLIAHFCLVICGVWASTWSGRTRQERWTKRSDKPNIVLILTDDQDELLGSMHVMPKTLRIMRDQGVHFNNSFVSTPMCCPSRSTLLTGMYTHNHNTYTNNDNCSSLYWQRKHETRSFATYLNDAGYRTGYFGKYLNEYNGTYIPPGWREWVGLIRNTRFYNYTVNFNGRKMKHGDNYYTDYFTDLIANDSVTFLKQSKQYFPQRPVMMMLSVPAPHGPEDSAPQYQHLFFNNTLHRTPSWNVAPNHDKQYLLKMTRKMEPIEQKFTDVLQQKRLQTLQSVDDMVEKVYNELWMLGELENTYIIYTSDHGYHLGQFGVIKGKALPYDFDTRVPLYMRGPGIRPRSKISNTVVNADLAPTILDMAGIAIPDHMDGRSVLPLIKSYRDPVNSDSQDFVKTRKPWRDTVLLERGKITTKKLKELMREQKKTFMENLISMPSIPDNILRYATPKQRRIYKICSKPENQPPCKKGQKHQCVREVDRKLPRLMKCRTGDLNTNEVLSGTQMQRDGAFTQGRKRCICPTFALDREERRNQRIFLQKHLTKQDFKPKFMRSKRSLFRNAISTPGQPLQASTMPVYQPFQRRCRVLQNDSVQCDNVLYNDPNEWRSHKETLDEMIQEYRKMLEDLRRYRKHLKDKKPKHSYLLEAGGLDGPGYLDTQLDMNGVPCDCDEDGAMLGGSLVYVWDTQLDVNGVPCDCDEDGAMLKRVERKKEIEERRRRKKEKRKKRRKLRKRRRRKKDCSKPDVKCNDNSSPLWNSAFWNVTKVRSFNHPACRKKGRECYLMDNHHWKTPPLWLSSYWNLPPDEKVSRRRHPACKRSSMDCVLMDNSHWKTPPYWTNGPFCFCTNSVNNTYWCLRTVNQTHDLLYCEFINNFISYYDMKSDPFQLRNAIHDINYGILQQLHDQLDALRACEGSKECNKAGQGPAEEIKTEKINGSTGQNINSKIT